MQTFAKVEKWSSLLTIDSGRQMNSDNRKNHFAVTIISFVIQIYLIYNIVSSLYYLNLTPRVDASDTLRHQ